MLKNCKDNLLNNDNDNDNDDGHDREPPGGACGDDHDDDVARQAAMTSTSYVRMHLTLTTSYQRDQVNRHLC